MANPSNGLELPRLEDLLTSMGTQAWQELLDVGDKGQREVRQWIDGKLQGSAQPSKNGAPEGEAKGGRKAGKSTGRRGRGKAQEKAWSEIVGCRAWRAMLKLWLEPGNYDEPSSGTEPPYRPYLQRGKRVEQSGETVGGVLLGTMLAKTLEVSPDADFFQRACGELSQRVIRRDGGYSQSQAKQVAWIALDEALRCTDGEIEPYLVIPQDMVVPQPWHDWPLLEAITKSQVVSKEFTPSKTWEQLERWLVVDEGKKKGDQATPDGQTRQFWMAMAFFLVGNATALEQVHANSGLVEEVIVAGTKANRFAPEVLVRVERWTGGLGHAFIKQYLDFLDVKTYRGSPNKCRGLANLLDFMNTYQWGSKEDRLLVQGAFIRQMEQIPNIRGVNSFVVRVDQRSGKTKPDLDWEELYYQTYAERTECPQDFDKVLQAWLMMAGQRGMRVERLTNLLELAIHKQWQTGGKFDAGNAYHEIAKNVRRFTQAEKCKNLKTTLEAFALHNAVGLSQARPGGVKIRL